MSAPIVVAVLTAVRADGRRETRDIVGEPDKPLIIGARELGVWCPDGWKDKKLKKRHAGRSIKLGNSAHLAVRVVTTRRPNLSGRQRIDIAREADASSERIRRTGGGDYKID